MGVNVEHCGGSPACTCLQVVVHEINASMLCVVRMDSNSLSIVSPELKS
jgi:hypothetical protein